MTNILITAIIFGVLSGTVYGLAALGLNIIYGVMKTVNLAHGEFMVLGAFTAYWCVRFGQPFLSFFLFPLFFFVGFLLYYVTVPQLLKAESPEVSSFLLFYGVSLVISAATLTVWGSDPRYTDYGLPSVTLAGYVIPSGRLVSLGVSVTSTIFLFLFLYRSHYGRAIRATAQSRTEAEATGINVNRASAMAFGISIFLTSIAGATIPLQGLTFSPTAGLEWLLIAFTVIVLGGLGKPEGALVGGLVSGLATNITSVYAPALSAAVPLFLLIIVMLLKPEGILGGA